MPRTRTSQLNQRCSFRHSCLPCNQPCTSFRKRRPCCIVCTPIACNFFLRSKSRFSRLRAIQAALLRTFRRPNLERILRTPISSISSSPTRHWRLNERCSPMNGLAIAPPVDLQGRDAPGQLRQQVFARVQVGKKLESLSRLYVEMVDDSGDGVTTR